jgi:ABC-type sugar transport system ATPase subunit
LRPDLQEAELFHLQNPPSDGAAVSCLRGRGLSKSFGHVRALHGVDIDVFGREVLAIVGDNGAGKSTLTKILSGVIQPDRGDIYIGREKVHISDARRAHELGVATVFQTLALVNCRDVACNLFLGREPIVGGIFVDRKKMLADARVAFAELGINIPNLLAEVSELSGGQRQCVAIARAMSQNSQIVIMDEPTAALGVKESGHVLDLIMRLRAAGRAVIIISHNMHHVFSVADRIMVLRRGTLAGLRHKSETTADEIVALIVGGDAIVKERKETHPDAGLLSPAAGE